MDDGDYIYNRLYRQRPTPHARKSVTGLYSRATASRGREPARWGDPGCARAPRGPPRPARRWRVAQDLERRTPGEEASRRRSGAVACATANTSTETRQTSEDMNSQQTAQTRYTQLPLVRSLRVLGCQCRYRLAEERSRLHIYTQQRRIRVPRSPLSHASAHRAPRRRAHGPACERSGVGRGH
jgi:hypothetical protein